MGRAEMRRKQKELKKKSSTYNISEENLDKIRRKEREDAVNDAIVLMMSLPIKVLKKHYKWGNRKRLPDFGELMCDAYQEFVDGGRDLEAEIDFVYQMTGIKFQKAEDV